MKRLFTLLLAIGLVVGLVASAAYAKPGAKKVDLVQYNTVEGEENADGWAMINYTPPNDKKKGTGAAVQIQVSGLLPNQTYQYYTFGKCYCTFTTNKLGKGHCHVNFDDEENIDPDWEINIWRGTTHEVKVLGT